MVKFTLHKVRTSAYQRILLRKGLGKPNWEKIFVRHVSDKVLGSRIYRVPTTWW